MKWAKLEKPLAKFNSSSRSASELAMTRRHIKKSLSPTHSSRRSAGRVPDRTYLACVGAVWRVG